MNKSKQLRKMTYKVNFYKRALVPGTWETHHCPLCPNIIGAYRNVFDQCSSKLYNHLISQHPHLVFQCGYGRGNIITANAPKNQIICNSKYQYFVSYDQLEKHLNTVHSNFYREAKVNMILPQDLRKATCKQCEKLLLCQGKFQIQKHAWLQHEDEDCRYILLSCRMCPEFETSSFEQWKNHFIHDNKGCVTTSPEPHSVAMLTMFVIHMIV